MLLISVCLPTRLPVCLSGFFSRGAKYLNDCLVQGSNSLCPSFSFIVPTQLLPNITLQNNMMYIMMVTMISSGKLDEIMFSLIMSAYQPELDFWNDQIFAVVETHQ